MATKTILIVDDEWMVLQVLEDLLTDAGYRTLTAQDGARALALLQVTHPNLIVTDLLMPIHDGFDFCHAVLANPATQTIPLVIMSATHDLRHSITFPIAGFLLKPFEVQVFLTLVAALIGSAAVPGA